MYECHFGYALIGDEYRTCQENGEWDGEEPSCICKYILKLGKAVSAVWNVYSPAGTYTL